MAQTSVYGLPYLELSDPPNIAAGTQGLAEAVEDELVRVDTAVGDIQSRLPQVLPGTCVARLRRTTSSTVANGAAIPWNTEDWDTLSAHASGASQYIPTVAGRYLVTAVVRHQAIAAGSSITADIRLNGAVTATAGTSANTSPSAGTGLTVTDVVTCNGTTDTIEIGVGNNQATAVNANGSVVTITYAGAA